MINCDRACKNQPRKHKKSPIFSSLLYHNLRSIYSNRIKSLSLLQNIMGLLEKFTELDTTFRAENISKSILGIICAHMVDFRRPSHNYTWKDRNS